MKMATLGGFIGLAVLASVVSLYARWQPYFPGDLRLTLLFQSLNNTTLLRVMEWSSYLVQGPQVVALVVASALVAWRFLGRAVGIMVLAAALTSLINIGLKLAIGRPRPTPDLVHVLDVYNHSSGFPSGHAFFAGVFLGFVAYMIATCVRRRRLRVLSLAGLLIYFLSIGASRVYLGAHWTSDVLGGYLIGGLFLAPLIWVYRMWKPR